MKKNKEHPNKFYKDVIDQLERLIEGVKKMTQPEHPSDHKPQMREGNCLTCRWLDPKAKENRVKGPAGLTMFESMKLTSEDFELALSAVRALNPEQLHALAMFIKEATVSQEELLLQSVQLRLAERLERKIDGMLTEPKGPIQ